MAEEDGSTIELNDVVLLRSLEPAQSLWWLYIYTKVTRTG